MSASQIRRPRRGDEGFTLIELLIVIIILGILAAVVVFSVRGIADRGSTAACKTEVRTVETAAEAYYAKKGNYPTWAQLTATGADQFLHSVPSIVVAADYDASTGDVTHAC